MWSLANSDHHGQVEGNQAQLSELLHMMGKLAEGQKRLEDQLDELCSGQNVVTSTLRSVHSAVLTQGKQGLQVLSNQGTSHAGSSDHPRLTTPGQAWLQEEPEEAGDEDVKDDKDDSKNTPESQGQNLRITVSQISHVSLPASTSLSAGGFYPVTPNKAFIEEDRRFDFDHADSFSEESSLSKPEDQRRISKTDGGLKRAVAVSLGLEDGWPKNLKIREQLHGPTGAVQSAVESRRSYYFSRTEGDLGISMSSVETPTRDTRRKQTFVLDPSSTVRIFVDLMSLLVLIYDMTVTPWVVAWNVPLAGPIKMGNYLTLAFWTLDMFLSFRTGFYRFGELEMRPKMIAQKYFRTFFIPDLFVIVTDVANIVLDSIEDTDVSVRTSESMRVLRAVKATRFLRILGVLRLGHCMEVLSRINDRHSLLNENSYFVGEVILLILTILWLNHVVGCVWFLLGNTEGDTGSSWLDQPITPTDSSTYRNANSAYQYLTSFHWSVSQMTPGSMQVSPVNSQERQFSIVCLILGMLIFGTLVSSLSAKMMHVKVAMQESNKRMNTLRRFLRSSGVSAQLAVSIQKQAMERQRLSRKPLTVNEVQILNVLSLSMRTELMWELCRPLLQRHPIFRLFEGVDAFAAKKICREAIDFIVLSPGDTLFQPGVEAQNAYVVVSGTMRYLQEPTSSPVVEALRTEVLPGMWLCEATLWAVWTHVGTAEAINVCQLMSINVKRFISVLLGRTLIQEVAWEYAVSYHTRLTSAASEENWPNDLGVPWSGFDEMLISMRAVVQVFVGLMAIRMARAGNTSAVKHRWSRPDRNLSELEDEVRMRRCIVLVNGAGEIQRVTAVTVVRLYNATGDKFLAQLGKSDDFGRMEAKCLLPGMKVDEGGEMDIDSLRRLLQRKLQPFARAVLPETHSMKQEVEEEVSRSCGFHTKYIKTIHSVRLSSDFDSSCLDIVEESLHSMRTMNRVGTELMLLPRTSFISRMMSSGIRKFFTGREERGRGIVAHALRERFAKSDKTADNLALPTGLEVFLLPDMGDVGFRGDSLPLSLHPAEGDVEGASYSNIYLYAWVTEKEFDFFNTAEGNETLRHFVSSLNICGERMEVAVTPKHESEDAVPVSSDGIESRNSETPASPPRSRHDSIQELTLTRTPVCQFCAGKIEGTGLRAFCNCLGGRLAS